MTSAFYRTGQAAKLLSISTHHLRRLCEAGMIEADLTQGNQWRIPAAEVERLKADGVPPIPQLEPEDERPGRSGSSAGSIARNGGSGRAAEPPPPPVVQAERDELEVTRARLARRQLELEEDEIEDAFRERQKKRSAEQDQEERRREQEQIEAERAAWYAEWLRFALNQLPAGCSDELQAEAIQASEKALRAMSPSVPDDLVMTIVKGAIQPTIRQHERTCAVVDVIERVHQLLPDNFMTPEETRKTARQLVASALNRIPADSTPQAIREAAKSAVKPLCESINSVKVREAVIDGTSYWELGFNASPSDLDAAKIEVRQALEQCPQGTPQGQLESIRDRILAGHKERIDARRKAVELANQALNYVEVVLKEDYEFDSCFEEFQECQRIENELRPELLRRFLDGRLKDLKGGKTFVEEWIEER